jgi:hypothetical protein
MKPRLESSALACLLVLALPACGSGQNSSNNEAVPEQAAFELGVTDDPASEATATSEDSVDPASDVDAGMDAATGALDIAPELAAARDAVRDLNQALRRFMQPIVALVRDSDPASDTGSTRTWGPVTRGETEFVFVLHHGTGRHYGWILRARPAGSSGDYTIVAAGGITVGYAPRRGRGTIGLDLDALGSVDPTVAARGKLLVAFAHAQHGSVVGYRLAGFSPDPTTVEPIDALAQRVHLDGGYNRVRLAYRGNLPESATDAPELVLARLRHQRGVGGRSDALVTSGDVPDGHVFVVNECWDKALASGYRLVRDCPSDAPGGDACVVVVTRGDQAACSAFPSPELPPLDPQAAMPDPASVAGDVTPPDQMPDGTPPSN